MRSTYRSNTSFNEKRPWNSGRIIGQKPPLKRKDIWAIRGRLQLDGRNRFVSISATLPSNKEIIQVKITRIEYLYL